MPHLWPVDRVLAPWPMGERFLWETKRGVLSYVIARPLMTAVSVVANIAGVYGDGEWRRDRCGALRGPRQPAGARPCAALGAAGGVRPRAAGRPVPATPLRPPRYCR